jgi:N-methylhydantoinase A
MIDIHTIGAGGGSIAWVSAGGKPQVGPRSAGADPGPAAYGRGGTEATVTDANLVLGRLPSALLDGRMQLDVERARDSVSRFGAAIGLDVLDAAVTIVELAIHNMDLAIREVSTRKGRDPRECALLAFGGAGPGHAARLGQLLQVPTVLFPHSPGVGSTFGLLSTDVRTDLVQSILLTMEPGRVDGAASVHEQLARQAWAALEQEGVPEGQRLLLTSADFRYTRQQYTINVDVPHPAASWNEQLTAASLVDAVEAFHRTHRALCGFDYRGDPTMGVELINLRVAAVGRLSRPAMRELVVGDGDPSGAFVESRPIFFESSADFVETPVYDRARLRADDALDGPAVIEEFDSTSLVLPGQSARIDRFGNILVALDGA